MKRALTITLLLIATITACKKDDAPPTAPMVTTSALTNVTTTGATAGGTITSNGGAAVTASGIVLSRSNNTPTVSDTVMNATAATGSFTVNLTNLDFGTSYYIRAYATNSVGTAYGDVVTLNTTNDTSKVRFDYNGSTVTYGVITSSVTKRKWMDRNLGANAVATSLTDTAGYGHLFQWGRLADGHQLRTSAKNNTLSGTDVPGHGDFIVPGASANLDWRDPQNDNLWQGSNGKNNPCPSGWHVPTKAEWEAENITDENVGFNNLKMSFNGARSRISGNFVSVDIAGNYWSSTIETNSAWEVVIPTVPGELTAIIERGLGAAVRCIKD